jgi:Cu/Zn superoxide dismutase
MNRLARTLSISVLASAVWLSACSDNGTGKVDAGSGGRGGSGTGGSGTGGSGTGGSGTGGSGTGGSATGGSGGAATGGSGGSATGGSGGGSGGSGGSAVDAGGGDRPAGDGSASDGAGEGAAAEATALATIAPTTGNTITGTATFTQRAGQVTAVLVVANCPPGNHAWHLHASASCSNNGEGAGAHWVPQGEGLPDINCAANMTGQQTVTRPTSMWTIGGGATNVLPHALIVHANPELPANPGPGGRIGCGVLMMQ